MRLKREFVFFLLVLVAVLFVLRDFLGHGYPPSWGGDAYGHLFKIWKLMPGYSSWIEDWYGGYPFLRFYPPLSYYIGAFFGMVSGSALMGYKITIVIAMLLGAVSMRILLRNLGFSDVTSYAVSIAYILAPYHLRILSPEGNFPRFVGINLAPLLLLAVLYVWRGDRPKALIGGVFLASVLLSHHTLVVTFGLMLVPLIPYLLSIERPSSMKVLRNSSIAGVTALALSAFWIIPFLLERGQAHFLKENSIEYLFRLQSAKLSAVLLPGEGWSFYQGTILYLGVIGALLTLPRPKEKRLLGAGVLVGILASIALSLGYYGPFPELNRLPLLNMVPPYRWLDPLEFFSALGFALLLERIYMNPPERMKAKRAILAVVIILIVLSISDVRLRLNSLKAEEFPGDYAAVLNYIANDNGTGWRYLQWGLWSTQGSRIAYTPAMTGKPILGGWYRQGDPAYPQHTYLNYAIAHDRGYAEKALRAYSVKYVIVDSYFDDAKAGEENLRAMGFREVYSAGSLRLYSWDNWSFLIPKASILVIGNWPLDMGVEYEKGSFIDDYVQHLNEYSVVILDGYKYRDPLVWRKLEEYVKSGGVLVVNTFRSPDAMATRLGVKSVIVHVKGRANLTSSVYNVSAFSNFTYEGDAWTATVYEGNLTPLIKLGNATVLGFRDIGMGRVYFIGLNLPYHAVYTKNEYEAMILKDLLSEYITAPSVDYRVVRWKDGELILRYRTERSTAVILAENYYPHWRAYVDGREIKVSKDGNLGLIELSLPGGEHELRLNFEDPYRPLRWLSLGSLIAALVFLARWRIKYRPPE
ncbi:6-pyruvoyl-tetrahydropterin synthase-related protein [Thermococcus sp. AM4]|uniref:6-pyruvoyl-tetrahydropterin synthase-related protein n=1 Tax=Thermococcus sp. (strain AM4) TaxID=246969 RepID=UPI0001870D08|nr:6-pyruvoyl-tetrahydropterin synthase-related protein [Thermococcus sp. AM4]EEB73154.1 hypothetical protein TAM4_2011 [Thermococcus sp. AM4]